MFRALDQVPSQAMGRRMYLWRYGHFGAPLLVFPTAAGFAHEWEAQGMVEALAPLIDAGKLKLYCTESNVAEAWTRHEHDPAWRLGRHLAFERYVLNELVPRIREDCRSERIRIAVAGSSLGALYSANAALKHPEVFHWALCMSGRYNAAAFFDGLASPELYFSNPIAYVPGLAGPALERVRDNTHLVLVCGQGRWENGNVQETNQFADLLAARGISHQRDIWGHDVSHEWPWWRRQAAHHLQNAFGTS
ncbi:MAG TPA: alpha/beta hydrolase-fold protein [Candidatus Polarisedimenticolaceae bacterium]|nr:alpha/beta hydrolase-fold protein [Candidatus Polarisedimenticolaceae bacterium]